MLSANKILLIGQIGREIDLRKTVQGRSVCTFTLATHHTEHPPDGPSRERTLWHPIVAWDRLGEQCAEHLRMGDTFFIEGHLHYPEPEVEDASADTPSTWEVTAITVQFIKHRELPDKPADFLQGEDEST